VFVCACVCVRERASAQIVTVFVCACVCARARASAQNVTAHIPSCIYCMCVYTRM